MAKEIYSKKHIRSISFEGYNLSRSEFRDCLFEAKSWWKNLHIIFWLVAGIASSFFSVLSSFFLLFPFLFAAKYGGGNNYINYWISLCAILSLIIFLCLLSKQDFINALLKGLAFLFFPFMFGIMLSGQSSQIGISFLLGASALVLETISIAALYISNLGLSINFKAKLNSTLISLLTGTISAFFFASYLGLLANFTLAIIILLLANFFVAECLGNQDNCKWLHDLTIGLATIGGSSFRNADLTDADFTRAILKNVSLKNANITRTFWLHTQGLEQTALENTYLSNSKIRQLVVSCDGQGQTFDELNLTGVNLHGANLQDVSFIGAILNQSNLSRANLSRAILKQTQLDGADLTGAILTGACIEDWGITNTTKLDNVQCDYVFMRVETKDNPNRLRKPDNWRENFANGEFADFIQPFFDTLDLYHSQDVDPRAISIALKSLADAHPDDDLQFVAMERRGKNGLNLRFTTAPKANKSELSHEYFANYAQIKQELPVAVQMRIAEQDAEIRTLKGTIEQFILTGTHQSNIQAGTIQVIQGELVMAENKGINISAGDNANISGLSSGDGIVNLGAISGNVTNSINQLSDSSESDELELKALLIQLQQAIETDTNLSDPDKSDLLEQVQSLAEVKQVEEPAKREGIARKAIKIFDATLKSLPDTARIVEACSKLLPLILTALGLPI